MPMPRRPTQMARTCIIARSRAALLRPACAIERAAVGAVDDGDRAARIALAIIGFANEIRLGRARLILKCAIAVVDRLDIGGLYVAVHPRPVADDCLLGKEGGCMVKCRGKLLA